MPPRASDLEATAKAHEQVASTLRELAREAKKDRDLVLYKIAMQHARQAKNVADLYRKADPRRDR